jgi:hypothetical protein
VNVPSKVPAVAIDSNLLERLNRDELIAKARQLGAKRAELLTRPELRDEIIRLSADSEEEGRRARGWFGVARDLVASVVGQGLNLPDTADLIRGVHVFSPKAAAPVATVTLAEIYAAQGHVTKALDLLDEVLVKEPDHEAARQARERWAQIAVQGSVQIPVQDSAEEASVLVDVSVAENRSFAGAAESEAAAQNDTISSEDFALRVATEPRVVEPIAARETSCTELQATAASGATELRGSGPAVVSPLPPTRRERTEDRLVVLRNEDASLLCDWELTPKTLDRLRAEAPTGVLTLRIIEVTASWDGPVTQQNDLELHETLGRCSATPLGAGNEVRVVLGWRTEQRFVVVALGAEFGWSRATGALLRWAPPHTMSADAWQLVGGATVDRLLQRGPPV